MIEIKVAETSDGNHTECWMEMNGSPAMLGAEMHAAIKAFTLSLMQKCYPGCELNVASFLSKNLAKAPYEAYQEFAQKERAHEAAE